MSEFDLTPIDGGALQPYSPDAPTAPSDSGWMIPQPDFVNDHQSYSSAPQLFGADLPAGTTMDQARAVVKQITDAFAGDMAHLKFDSWMVKEAVNWFKSEALLPPGYVEPTHRYNLRGYRIPEADQPAVNSFLNAMYRANVPQRFCQAALWWLTEFGKPNTQQSQSQYPSQDDITDQEWAIIEKRCPADRAACDAALRAHWGSQYKLNLRIVKDYLATLPVQERERLETTVCKGGLLSGNSPEVIVGIFNKAIGADTIPQNGPALAAEIAQIENLMKTNRKAYLADERTQARLRQLYTLRGY